MVGKRRVLMVAFGIFLVFMGICTLVAKGIYTSGLPKVTWVNPEERYINHNMVAFGAVKQGQEFGIYVESGLRVAAVLVKTGDMFEEGKPLFKIDTDDLQKVIEEKELALAKLVARQKENASSDSLEKKKEKLSLSRAQEDYNLAVRDGDNEIYRKCLALADAEKALDEYKSYLSGISSSVSGGDSETGSAEKQKQLEKAVNEASRAVREAESAKERLLISAARAVEDAKLGAEPVYSATREAESLEAEHQRKAIAVLEELLLDNGRVCSEESGLVTNQMLKVGERTLDTACLLYARNSGEQILEVPLTQEQVKYVELGDSVNMQYNTTSGKSARKDGVIAYLSSSSGSPFARVELGNMEVRIGQSVIVRHTKQSEAYSACIPLSALHTDAVGISFVYLIDEQEGILGKEWRILRVVVTVLDKNESFAAIESAQITKESRIVYTQTKEINEGDVVRVVE